MSHVSGRGKKGRPLAGKPSRVLAGPPTEFCRELVAWEPMKGLWPQTTSAAPPTEEQALDLAWDSAEPPTEEQVQASAGPPVKERTTWVKWSDIYFQKNIFHSWKWM